MIDYGLLMSVIVTLAASSLAMRLRPPRTYNSPVSALDIMLLPGLVGLVVGRLSTLAIDDPRAIGQVSDMLVIRSGVEFWPGVAAAAIVIAWSGHRAQVSPIERVADLAPFAMVAYGTYEAACLFRDGCYGPTSPVGLTPNGLSTTMLPVGLLMGASALAAAAFVRRQSLMGWPPGAVVSSAVALIGLILSVGSIWLPKVGGELSRQHRTSIVVAVAASVLTGSILLLRSRRRVEQVHA